MRVLVSLSILVGLHNTPPCFKRYVVESNVFLGYPKRGITCSLNPFRDEQYPSDSLDQNNSAHGVFNVRNVGIVFLLCFVKAMQ